MKIFLMHERRGKALAHAGTDQKKTPDLFFAGVGKALGKHFFNRDF